MKNPIDDMDFGSIKTAILLRFPILYPQVMREIEQILARYENVQKAQLNALNTYYNSKKKIRNRIYVKIQDLAETFGIPQRTVRKILEKNPKLVQKGYGTVEMLQFEEALQEYGANSKYQYRTNIHIPLSYVAEPIVPEDNLISNFQEKFASLSKAEQIWILEQIQGLLESRSSYTNKK